MTIEELLHKATDGLNAGRAFGPVIERDDCVVIPVAFVASGGGGGEATEGSQGGTGGGVGGFMWPIGAYVIKGGDVRWVPAVDVTLVALGALVVARAILNKRARRRRT